MVTQAYFSSMERNAGPLLSSEAKQSAENELFRERVCRCTALSIEFVAKPQEAAGVLASIPNAIESVLGNVPGFAGCVVMISDHEARLVTLITFWSGEDRAALSKNSAPWVYKIISPYLDHCLRVGWFHACAPAAFSRVEAKTGEGAGGGGKAEANPPLRLVKRNER